MRIYFFLLSFTVLVTMPLSAAMAEVQTLEQAWAVSYQTNPGLQAERAKLRATDEQVSQALSGWRPSVEATAEGGKSSQSSSGDNTLSSTNTLTPYGTAINVTQPVFSGFRTVGGVRSAEAAVKAQRASLSNAEQQLLLDSAKAYLDVAISQSVLELIRANEEVLQKQLAATRDRFRVGELKKTDVSQAESRLSTAMAARIRSEGDLANSRTTFTRLVGDTPGFLAAPQLVLHSPKTAEETVTLAGKQHPNILAASYIQEAARADVTVAEGSLLPEVSLVGTVSHSQEQSALVPERQDSASIMAKLTVPLYKSGTDYSKTRAAKQTSSQRRLEFKDTFHKVHETAASAWQSLMTARDAITANKSAVEANKMALYGVKEEYKVGTRTTLDVLNAEQELLNAKISLVKAERDESLAVVQVKASVGILTAQALHLPVEIYNPTINYDTVHDKWIGLGPADD